MLWKNSTLGKAITKIKLYVKYKTTVHPNSKKKLVSFKKKNAIDFQQEPK